MKTAFLTSVTTPENHTMGVLYSALSDAFKLFQAALSAGQRAQIFGLSNNSSPILICDTTFYEAKK